MSSSNVYKTAYHDISHWQFWKSISKSPSQADDSESASVVLQDIKALRTMTTLLSLIYPGLRSGRKAPDSLPPATIKETHWKEVKILSALATVLVIEYEVVAVVAKYGNALGGGGWRY